MRHQVEKVEGACGDLLRELEQLRTLSWSDTPYTAAVRGGALDTFDAMATHFLVRSGAELVGAGRVTVHEALGQAPDGEAIGALQHLLPPSVTLRANLASITPAKAASLAVFSRLVVRPDHRRRGISNAIDEHRIAEARRRGLERVIVSVVRDDHRDDVLRRRGFEAIGEIEKLERGIMAPIRIHLLNLTECGEPIPAGDLVARGGAEG